MKDEFRLFAKTLATWYAANKRDLPWRHTRNPYYIWVSEIILQQTQVAQGLDYYKRFIARFPNVKSLAEAPQDDVLKLWQGLGYYSRARNMQASAQQIMTQFSGIFPEKYADVLSLKGVGQYTAAAICSFAYRLPYATVDGNIYRVLSRYFDIATPIDTTQGQHEFAQLAQMLLDEQHPDTHNQALMEFGALCCTPTNPHCDECPLADSCAALANKTVGQRPCKQGKIHIRNRYFYYFLIKKGANTYLHQRVDDDIWKGLYELPLIESEVALTAENLLVSKAVQELLDQRQFVLQHQSTVKKHILSHQHIYAQCFTIEVEDEFQTPQNCIEIPLNSVRDYPCSRLMELLLEHC